MAQRGGDWRAEQERFERAEAAELQRELRARERQRAADEKDAARERKEARAAEAVAETAALDARVQELSEVLLRGVSTFDPLRPEHVVRPREVSPLALGHDGQRIPLPRWEEPAPPGRWSSMFGGRGRHERRREGEWARHEQARAEAETAEAARQARVGRKRRDHDEARQRAKADTARQHQWAAALVAGLTDREPAAVREMAELVLDRMPLPAGFPRQYEKLVSPDGTHVVVQWQLPASAVVPEQRAVQYLPTKDEKRGVPRARKECAALYRRVVAQLAVLVVRSVLVSDPGLERVTFSGHVEGVDPATGAEAYPCLLSLAVDRAALPPDENLVRDGFDPEVCVTALGALVSQHPYAQEPVEPFLDFDLTRCAFVDGLDAVSTLDSRPNLLEVSPSLFEHLVRQVLMQKGDEG